VRLRSISVVTIALFWFGPLSPLLQYGFLLWGAMGGVCPVRPVRRCPARGSDVWEMFEINRAMRRQAARRRSARLSGGDASCVSRTIPSSRASTALLMIEAATLAERNGDAAAVRDVRKGR